jgi:hypothetical protein
MREKYTELFDFLDAWFPDADLEGLSDTEVAHRYLTVESPETKAKTIQQITDLLNEPVLPCAELGLAANRCFNSESEWREWLNELARNLRGAHRPDSN